MRYTHYLHVIEKPRKTKRKSKHKPLVFTRLFNYWRPKGNLMFIEVKGRIKNKLKDELANAAEFYSSLLLPKRIVKDLYLTIEVKTKLDNGASGFCNYDDRDKNFREFTIELEKNSDEEELLSYLAHECVHMKQFALGEINNGWSSSVYARWQDTYVRDKEGDYWDAPWEIEAYGRERGLYTRYIEKFYNSKEES